jgi:hypothetical protein|tara:strand:- start:444 stop:1004 length:561 start_codon:yes stop_codon:yes gene_type:complete
MEGFYKYIPNFLTKEEINLLCDYTRIKHRINYTHFDLTQTNAGETYGYGDPAMESLLINKKERVEQEANIKLLPTYACWRMYCQFSDLEMHTDRDACEYSITANLGSDGTPFPIFMNDTPIEVKVGDAVLYKGLEIPHGRKEFEGDWHSQVFLHYVDANGPHKKWVKDGRLLWGMEETASLYVNEI